MSLESLAPELVSIILQNIDSPRGLHDLIAASPACLRVLLQAPYLILSAVVRNALPSGTMKHYLAASLAPLSPLRETRDEILLFLDEYFSANTPLEFPANQTDLVSFCKLYHRVDYLVNMFLHQMRQLGFDDSILAPSTSESTRLHRAFLRYEIYCSVFAPNEFEPLEDPYQFSGVEQFDLFLRRLMPWEVEEMACVQVYFALLAGNYVSQLEEQLIEAVKSTPELVWPSSQDSKPEEQAEKKEEGIVSRRDDMREFKNLDLTNLILFSKDGIYSSPDSITHMTSLGLGFMYVLCKSEDRRSELIRSSSPDYREFLPEALSHSPAWTPEDPNQGISTEETDSLDDPLRENLGFVLFGENHNMGTVYLPIDPTGSHYSILRRLGYVFWDSWRIQSPGVSDRLRAVEKMTYDEIHELFNKPWQNGAEARLQGLMLPRDQFEKIEREFGYIEDAGDL